MKTALIVINIFLFLLKSALRIHLDYTHKRLTGFPGPQSAMSNFLPYKKAVDPQFEKEKAISNFAYQIWLLTIVLIVVYFCLFK